MDHCSVQHTTSQAAKPHVSNHICNLQNRDRVLSTWSTHTNSLIPQRFWGTNPPTEGHRHSQAADTGRWPRRHLHITDTLPSSPSHRFYSFCYIYFIFICSFIFYTLYVCQFLCIILVYIFSYLSIHRRADYEVSASGPHLHNSI